MNKIVFDIGGNGVQYKMNNESIESFSTVDKDKEFVLNTMASLINDNNIQKIGISSPCGVDSETGRLYGISGIKDYEDFNLYEELKAKINHNVNIIAHNDANAALLGNLIGENYKSAAQVTIGTGVGGSLYINNAIFVGKQAMAGEFGYIPFMNKLNTSQMCSSNALVRIINENNQTDYKDFMDVLNSGTNYDKDIKQWAKNVAKLISGIFFSIAPEVLFISGGITRNNMIKSTITNAFNELMKDYQYDFDFEIKFKNIENPALKGMDAEITID